MRARWKDVLPAVFDGRGGENPRRFRFVHSTRSITTVVILGAAFSFTSVCMHADEPGCAGGGGPPARPPPVNPVTSPPQAGLPATQLSDIERRTREEQRTREEDAQIENIDIYGKGAGLSHYLENHRRFRQLLDLMRVRAEAEAKIKSYARDPDNRRAVERILALFNLEQAYQRVLREDLSLMDLRAKKADPTAISVAQQRVAAAREQMKNLFEKTPVADRVIIDPHVVEEMPR